MKKTLLLLVGIIIATGCLAAELPVVIKASNPSIRYIGRFTEDFHFNWSGCKIEIETDATAVNAILETVSGKPAGLTVMVNGKPCFLKVVPGQTQYPLAENLKPGRHRIELFKRSEATIGTVRFQGLELSEDAQLFPVPAPKQKLLVIGDSITCGYGNEASSVNEGNTVDNENGYMSYAAIAARELNSDLMMICRSGHGMHRNRSLNNDQVDTLPQLFERTLWNQTTPAWDHSRYVPDVVIINLGTNDNNTRDGKKDSLSKDDFIGSYAAFIERLRELYPDAHIILSIGPMTLEPIAGWLPEIADQFKNTSVLTYARLQGKADLGGHWHPSVSKHRKMAAKLVAEIRKIADPK